VRAVAFLNAPLTFSLKIAASAARETASTGTRQSGHFRRMRGLLQSLNEEASSDAAADEAAIRARLA